MTVRARRRRALVLLSLAVACGGLAASLVRQRTEAVEARVGRPVAVVVAARDLPAGAGLHPDRLRVRRVPARYLPPDALADPAEAAGARLSAPLRRGGYLTASLLGAGPRGGRSGALGRGERAVEVQVAGGAPLAEAAGRGTRVDVLVSTEPRAGPGRTLLALENVELLGLRAGAGGVEDPGTDDAGAAAAATAIAVLRVTLRQAVYLTAAQNFAREVRLLPRPPGDGARTGRAGVAAGEL